MKEKPSNFKESKPGASHATLKKEKTQKGIIFQEKPQICFIDIKKEIKDNLVESGFNVKSGTLGKKISVPNKYNECHDCLLNCFFPENLHEYEIIVLDLSYEETIQYELEQNSKKYVEGHSDCYFHCQHPQNTFNPKAYGSAILKEKLEENSSHPIILIIFADAYENIEYELIEYTRHDINSSRRIYNNYSFYPESLYFRNKTGKELFVQPESNRFGFYDFLNKYIKGATYYVFFENPKHNVNPENFVPIIKNSHEEIVSFVRFIKNYGIFVFPQIEDKNSFLYDLLTEQLPSFMPGFFPYNTKFKWLEDEEYLLPNAEYLLKEKESLIEKYKGQIEEKDEEIEANYKKYECLHHLLTESGDELVKHVKTFLEWLDFKNVRIMDKHKTNKVLEEDLQVEIEEGLLVIEVKGIGRTSKDEECNQIDKIKHRREKDRGKFDVFGLYIVNHQRFKPALLRENPPFNEQQIEDAESSERGLLTTWQLFNLYYSIKNECITKEESRKALLKYGLIEFSPQNCVPLGNPMDVYRKGESITLDLQHKIEINNELIIKRGYRYLKTKILEIRVHDESVESVDSGLVGISIGVPIKKSDELFIKNSSL